ATVCLSNVRSIATANLLYAQDNREMFVTWGGGVDRKTRLYPYLRMGANNADTKAESVWNCPEIRSFDEFGNAAEAGYGFNTFMNGLKLSHILRHSETVALADGGINDAGVFHTATHLMAPSRGTSANVGRPNPRHLGVANVGWVDGHVTGEKLASP